MKQHIKIFSLVLLLLAASAARAHYDSTEMGWNSEKRKTMARSYPLTDQSRVSIKNSFGNVTVLNWNRNEVKVEITITVKANSDEAASAILDAISIDEKKGTDISFETKFRSRTNNGRGKSSSMQIDYVVNIPATTRLKITNSFGNTVIPDRSGATELSQSYGDLTTGSLANTERLSVDFGKLVTGELENTRVHVKFSKVEIDKLSGNFDGNFQFCTKPSISFTPAIKNVNIETKYSDLTISLPKSFDANINITTSFGKITNNSSLKLTDKDGGPLTEIRHTAPSSRTDRKISIRSEFGKIRLQ
ncbi:hypothetical protein [Niabella hirudinis]|uniref:hypothetical protein n=1 Tax=Niabella hirudinis TaxID=1285929 RepID=UPI003EBD2D3E